MSDFIFGFGLFIAALSVFGLLRPRQLMNAVVHTVNQSWGLAFAVGIRLALGAAFLVSADQVAQPVFITVLGWLMLASAAAIAIMGRERMVRFTRYWAAKDDAVMRAWLVFGVVFGLAVAWAA